jgi:hypothetical protein
LVMEPGQDVSEMASLPGQRSSGPQTNLVTIVETTRRLIDG